MIFAQLMEWIHPQIFGRIVQRHQGDYKTHRFSCWDQFLCLAFAQLTYRESLRDIEVCLRSRSSQLYHLGIRGSVSRSTLAHANEHRPWQMYADLAKHLIGKARRLYAEDGFGVELEQTVYALDATTVDLCLSVFPWAHFRSTKAAIKINTQLDLRGAIPTAIHVTPGDVHEVNWLDQLIFEPGAFYIMDRGYLDFARLYRIAGAGAFFVIRAKRGLKLARLYSRPVDFASGVRCDRATIGHDHSRGLPLQIATYQILRRSQPTLFCFSYQSFLSSCRNHSLALFQALADRVVLPLDQTKPAHQDFLRNQ